MKRWLLLAMLAWGAVALAQQPGAEEDQGRPGDAESAVVQGASGAADANTDVAGKGSEAAAEPLPDEEQGEPEVEPDEEFTPTEEIPEDYPVPLPSDI